MKRISEDCNSSEVCGQDSNLRLCCNSALPTELPHTTQWLLAQYAKPICAGNLWDSTSELSVCTHLHHRACTLFKSSAQTTDLWTSSVAIRPFYVCKGCAVVVLTSFPWHWLRYKPGVPHFIPWFTARKLPYTRHDLSIDLRLLAVHGSIQEIGFHTFKQSPTPSCTNATPQITRQSVATLAERFKEIGNHKPVIAMRKPDSLAFWKATSKTFRALNSLHFSFALSRKCKSSIYYHNYFMSESPRRFFLQQPFTAYSAADVRAIWVVANGIAVTRTRTTFL